MRKIMFRHAGWMFAVVSGAAALAPAPAAGQEIRANSFEQIRMIARLGDTVAVTDRSGRKVKGKLADLSDSSLAILSGTIRREFKETDVMTLSQRQNGSPGTGAKWGLAIGGGIGLLGIATGGCEYECGYLALGAAFYAGVGAGIGAGIGALTHSDHVIYSRPGSATAAHLTLAPVVSRERKGAALTFGF